VHLTHNQGH